MPPRRPLYLDQGTLDRADDLAFQQDAERDIFAFEMPAMLADFRRQINTRVFGAPDKTSWTPLPIVVSPDPMTTSERRPQQIPRPDVSPESGMPIRSTGEMDADRVQSGGQPAVMPQAVTPSGGSSGSYTRPSGPDGSKESQQATAYQEARAAGQDDEGAKIIVAVTETEGGLGGAIGDQGQSRGGYQFHEGGQMPGFRAWLAQQGIQGDPNELVHDIRLTTRYAASGYLGRAIAAGRAQGLSGPALATYVQRHGQVSIEPERTGQNYERLFGQGQPAPTSSAPVAASPPSAPAPVASVPAPQAAGAPPADTVTIQHIDDGRKLVIQRANLDGYMRPPAPGVPVMWRVVDDRQSFSAPALSLSALDEARAGNGGEMNALMLRGPLSQQPELPADEPYDPRIYDEAPGAREAIPYGPGLEGGFPEQPNVQIVQGGPPPDDGSGQTVEFPPATQTTITQGGPPPDDGSGQVIETQMRPRQQPEPATAQQDEPLYLDQSMPAPPGWSALVNAAGEVKKWVQDRAQEAGQALSQPRSTEPNQIDRYVPSYAPQAAATTAAQAPSRSPMETVVKPINDVGTAVASTAKEWSIEPGGGGARQLERMEAITDQAARDQGIDPSNPSTYLTARRRAVQDPGWRARNPELAAEYDQLEQQFGLTVVGQAGDAGQAARAMRGAGRAASEAAESGATIGRGGASLEPWRMTPEAWQAEYDRLDAIIQRGDQVSPEYQQAFPRWYAMGGDAPAGITAAQRGTASATQIDPQLSPAVQVSGLTDTDLQFTNRLDVRAHAARRAEAERLAQGGIGSGGAGHAVHRGGGVIEFSDTVTGRPMETALRVRGQADTVTHEVGHTIYDALPESLRREWEDAIHPGGRDAFAFGRHLQEGGERPPTSYAGENPGEDFADTFRVWRRGGLDADTGQSAVVGPQREAFMRRVDEWLNGGVSPQRPGLGSRIRGALDANAERVATADARAAEQGSVTTNATFGQAPRRGPDEQRLTSEFGRRIEETPDAVRGPESIERVQAARGETPYDNSPVPPNFDQQPLVRDDAPRGGSITLNAGFGFSPEPGPSRRMYHGTGGDFARPEAGHFAENGLYGPGYYLTDDPAVAGGYAMGRGAPVSDSTVEYLQTLRAQRERALNGTARVNDPPLERIEAGIAHTEGLLNQPGPNVRAVDIPPSVKIFDSDAAVAPADARRIARVTPRIEGERFVPESYMLTSGGSLRTALWEHLGDWGEVNRVLHAAGFDGIQGRSAGAASGGFGGTETVIFPESLDKIRNGFSGEIGGATMGFSPSSGPDILGNISRDVGSAIGSSMFGGAVGAGLPADSEEERLQNIRTGAGIGLIGGPLARRVARGSGAMATPGISPGRPDPGRRLQLRGNPINMTPAQETSRLRLDKFPEPLRPHIQRAAEATGYAHDARRGVIPDNVAEQAADGVNRSVDDWITKSRAGRSLNTEETRALRNLVTGQAKVVDDLAQEIADAEAGGVVTDLLITRAHQEGEKLASLVSVMEGARAEAGRTLRAWQANTRPTDPAEAAQRIFNKFGGGPEGRQRALDALKEFNQIPVDDPIARANFWARVERGGKITTTDVLTAIRYNSMLSSPRTWEIGWVGSVLQAPLKIASDVLAAVSRPLSGEMGEAAKGAAMGIRAGFRPLWETIAHGITSDQALAGQLPRGLAARATSPVGKIAGTLIDLPGRMVAAPDAFFTSVFSQAEKGRQAAIAAYKQGLKGAERDAFISNFMQNTPKEAQAEVDRIVDGLMLRGDMGRIGRWASGVATKDPLIGSFVAPFMKVSYHVWTQGMDLTPVGALGTVVDVARGAYRNGARPEGVKPLAERARMNAIGLGITGAATWQALHGNVSGAGPDDPEKRDQLRATGWQPYSVKLGDKWVSYANWGPVAVPLSLAAAYAENQQYKKPDAKPEDQMFDMAKRVTQLVTEQTFLQGIGTIMNAFEDPQRYLPTLLAQQGSSFIPYGSMLNTVGQSQDDYQRRPDRPSDVGLNESLSQSLQGRTPMNPLTPDRGDVPIAQGPLGKPIQNQQRGAMAFQPFRISQQKDDETAQIAQAFLGVGVDIGRPPSSFTDNGVKIDMTPDQQRAYQRYMGEFIERGFGRANNASDRRRPELLKALYDNAREHAAQRVRGEIGRSEIRNRVRAGSGQR